VRSYRDAQTGCGHVVPRDRYARRCGFERCDEVSTNSGDVQNMRPISLTSLLQVQGKVVQLSMMISSFGVSSGAAGHSGRACRITAGA
jgi:hypothetical protein